MRIDIIAISGIVLALAAIVVAVLLDGNSFAPLLSGSAFVLVILGTAGVTASGTRLDDLKRVPFALRAAVKDDDPDLDGWISQVARLADVQRRDGLLALEDEAGKVDDPFIVRGLQMLVDGQDGEQIRQVLDLDIDALAARHQAVSDVFRRAGGYAPTIGMIGTVIGLVNMLGQLEDPEQLGLGLALALLTTLYGVTLANLVLMPLADKLEKRTEQEVTFRQLMMDALLAMQAGINPRHLVDRLESSLPEGQRKGSKARVKKERSQ